MTLLQVNYGSQTVLLRNWREDGQWLKGIACNEFGVADREWCSDAEMWILIRRIEQTHEVQAMEFL